MKADELKTGSKVEFTPTGNIFEIAKVTESRISWYLGFAYKGGSGKNNLKMASTTLKKFQSGIDNGNYKVI
jgi:hypothetical protein